MKIEIKSWWTGAVVFEVEADSIRAALEIAVGRGANLGGADLGDANLGGADLGGARLETGETFAQYVESVVPALCTAGGRTLEEVAAAWDCHSWDNCPMRVAFNGAASPDDDCVPPLLRPRVHQFLRLFDAKLLPNPLGEKAAPACPATPGQ